MKEKLLSAMLFTCVMVSAYGQGKWEKLTKERHNQAKVSTEDKTRPFEDKEYDFGSETTPSPRADAVTWSDGKGNLWLFGGAGWDENYQWGVFEDLWRYNAKRGIWQLLSGERNNVESKQETSDFPHPRKEAVSWMDSKDNLWMYGGRQLGYALYLDDLWMYDVKASRWANFSSKGSFNNRPQHGKQKTPSEVNTPGSRAKSAAWIDKKGNLWLFGGQSFSSKGDNGGDFYNDLWLFNSDKKQWVWMSGRDAPNLAEVSEKEEQAQGSFPSPRSSCAYWYDSKEDKLWIYGGVGYNNKATELVALSDIWSYNIEKDTWESKTKTSIPNEEANFVSTSANEYNSPGYRVSPITWIDKEGNFLMTVGHNSILPDQIYIEKNIWVYSVKANAWAVIPQSEVAVTGSGASVTDEEGNVYIISGQEFDKNEMKTRPSNTVWKLKK